MLHRCVVRRLTTLLPRVAAFVLCNVLLFGLEGPEVAIDSLLIGPLIRVPGYSNGVTGCRIRTVLTCFGQAAQAR